jgi:uncharacterized protein (DUF697 family)
MGVKTTIAKGIGKGMISAVPKMAPMITDSRLRKLMDVAIHGAGKFPGAMTAAGNYLKNADGDVELAVERVIRQHTLMAGAQGFLTNLGGVATMAASMPANIAGLAIVQARMAAAVAHLRGYNLYDQRVRSAVLASLLGESTVKNSVANGSLPSTPSGIATAPMSDIKLESSTVTQVVSSLLSQRVGKQAVSSVTKKIPVIGGGVGAATDGYSTAAIGRYVKDQFVSHRQVS